MAKFEVRSFTSWLSLFLSIAFAAGWFAAVIGVGEMDNDCNAGDNCRALFRPIWWALIFEACVYFFLMLAWLGGFVDKVRSALIAFLILSAVNTEDEAEEALRNREDDGIQGILQTGILTTIRGVRIEHNHARAAATGFVILTFCNFMFILVLGCKGLMEDVTLPTINLRSPRKDGEKAAGGEDSAGTVNSNAVRENAA